MLLRMQAELIYFALSMAAGVLAAVSGSGIKWLHRRRKLAVWLGFLDVLYWLLLGFLLFLLCFYQNSGIFRGYAVAGTLAGYGLFSGVARLRRKDRGWRSYKRRVKKHAKTSGNKAD